MRSAGDHETAEGEAAVHLTERTARITAPGNLLVCGEYAVLEPGGLGIAVAVAPYAAAEIRSGRPAIVRCLHAGTGERYYRPGESPEPDTQLPAVCLEYLLRHKLITAPPRAEITLDSRAFFSASGGKRGFGSSAAATVVCTAAILYAAGFSRARVRCALTNHTVAIHREFQGGRGSGYDVLISALGGVALFTGGRCPRAEPLDAEWLRGAFLVSAGPRVQTTGAVRRYEAWKSRYPQAAAEFLRTSNELVGRLAAASSRHAALAVLERLAGLGIELGEAIAVPAALSQTVRNRVERQLKGPNALRGNDAPSTTVCKSLGAGGELALCLPGDAEAPTRAGRDCDTIQPLQIASEGVSWNATDPIAR